MVEGSAINGSGVGAGDSWRGELAPRTRVRYRCANGHEVGRSFATDVAIPDEWECPHCGLQGARDGIEPAVRRQGEQPKSHLAYVRERRSEEAGKALLDEALERLRRRREV